MKSLNVLVLLALVSGFTPVSGQVRNASPAVKAYTLGTAIVSVGRDDNVEGHDLFRVSMAKWGANETLVIANSGGPDVRVFDRAGKLKTSFGTEGDGPGEFRGLGWTWLGRGDTVITFDGALRRVTFWTQGGRRIRDVAVSKEYTDVMGRMADGRFVEVRQSFKARPAEGKSAVDTVTIALYDGARGIRTDIAKIPSQTKFGARIPNGGVIQTPLPLLPRAVYAHDEQRVYVGYSGRTTIDAYTRDGKLVRSIKTGYQPARMTPAIRKTWSDSLAATLPGDRVGAMGFVNSLQYPTHLPAYDVMIVDDLGNLWVRQFLVPGGKSASWKIFSRDGAQIGTMTLPASLRLQQVGSNFLVAATGGRDETEVVTVYRLSR